MSNDAKYKKPLEDLFKNTKAINEGEIAATLRKENAELERYEEGTKDLIYINKIKKRFIVGIPIFVLLWLILSLTIVLLDSWYNWGIHQLVLSTIIGSTTIGVLYLLRLIVIHIFPNRDKP